MLLLATPNALRSMESHPARQWSHLFRYLSYLVGSSHHLGIAGLGTNHSSAGIAATTAKPRSRCCFNYCCYSTQPIGLLGGELFIDQLTILAILIATPSKSSILSSEVLLPTYFSLIKILISTMTKFLVRGVVMRERAKAKQTPPLIV